MTQGLMTALPELFCWYTFNIPTVIGVKLKQHFYKKMLEITMLPHMDRLNELN